MPDIVLQHPVLDQTSDHLVFMERLSHDMSSLLASILGYACLIADPTSHGPEVNLATCGTIIVKQVTCLQKMVTDAKTITRINENQLNLTLIPICLGPLLHATIDEAREQNGREIIFRDESAGRRVMVDPLPLCEAFNNILDNAIKFSNPDTSIEVNFMVNETSGWAELQVKDYGIGIPAVNLPQLFRPFGRLCSDKSWSIPGNGLGLYIAWEIVAKLRGEITVESQLDQGSIFTIKLPLYKG